MLGKRISDFMNCKQVFYNRFVDAVLTHQTLTFTVVHSTAGENEDNMEIKLSVYILSHGKKLTSNYHW
jgi:hypothetical protein